MTYYEKNRAKLKRQSKLHYIANKETINAYTRNYMKSYYQVNKLKIIEGVKFNKKPIETLTDIEMVSIIQKIQQELNDRFNE